MFHEVGWRAYVFHIAPRSGVQTDTLEQVLTALKNALEWLGAGAKTSAGYGYMSEDARYAQDLKEKQAAQAQSRAKEQALNAKLANLSPLAQDYFRQANKEEWSTDKNKFLQAGVIEVWLDKLEETADSEILNNIVCLVETHIVGLLDNPNKVKGKKAKPVYNDRQRKIAESIKRLQENNT